MAMSRIYDIIKVPHASLKAKAHTVENVNEEIRDQLDTMLDTMYDASGIGLAANQVDILNRVLVMDVPKNSWKYAPEREGVLPVVSAYRSDEGDENGDALEEPISDPIAMVNPEVIWESEQKSVFEEGCLSIPKQYAEIVRPAKVRVKYIDFEGQETELEAEGLQSHCVQHEIDHLNGVLFIDYLSSLKRNMMVKRVQKMMKQQAL